MIIYINILLTILAVSYIAFYFYTHNVTKADFKLKKPIKYIVIGFITNFFDFFGIGSYAPQTLFLKHDIPEIYLIPGTMTIANYIPIVFEAFITITIVKVDALTLIILPLMAALGSYVSVKFITIERTNLIHSLLMVALFISGVLLLFNAFDIYPFNNIDTNLYGLQAHPQKLLFAAIVYFCLGALQSFGLGIYAPGFAILGLLGVSYIAILPINMLSSVLLSTSNSFDFIKKQKFDPSYVMFIGISGIFGVLLAGYVATIINLNHLIYICQIIVAIIVFATSWQMYRQLTKNSIQCKI